MPALCMAANIPRTGARPTPLASASTRSDGSTAPGFNARNPPARTTFACNGVNCSFMANLQRVVHGRIAIFA
jgi:hypothetical protein